MDDKERIITYWNNVTSGLEPGVYAKEDFNDNNELSRMYQIMKKNCSSILDIGSGLGFSLLEIAFNNENFQKGLGIDASNQSVDYANKLMSINNIKNVEFKLEDESYLDTLEDNSFDGIICNNILDATTKEASKTIIKDIKRILKENGYLLLKVNYYVDDYLIKKIKKSRQEGNYIYINDVLRIYNLTSEEWLSKFKGFELKEETGILKDFNMPCDRIFLLQKVGK